MILHALAARLRYGTGHLKVLSLTLLFLVLPAGVRGQAVQVQIGYTGALLSTSGWSPSHGPYIGVTLGRWLGAGLRIEYRSQVRDGGEISGFCGAFTCTDGPFEETLFLRSFGLGVSRPVLHGDRVELLAVVRGGLFMQGRHLTHVITREEFDRSDVFDYGLGAGLEAHLSSGFWGLTPMAWVAYDRLFQRECPADSSCYGGRNHLEFGMGMTFGR